MLFAIGLIIEFTIGGLSGVTHSVAPSDTQQTDTYYIVAHFHYVIFGGGVLGLFAGMYYWWPKVFGKMLSEKLGKWNFWFMIVGMNLTFGPMHILGLQGQPRRMYVWTEERAGEGFFNLGFWNLVSSIGTVVLGDRLILFFFVNVWADPQGAARPGRPVGRPQPRMDHVEPAEGAQLRAHPDRARARRVLPPQVRRRRHRRPPRVQEGRHGRGSHRRGGGARRCAHPPAVAVVLADHARPSAADHGLRRHLPHAADRGRAALLVGSVFGWALEPSTAPDSPTSTRQPMAARRARSSRSMSDTTITEPGITEPDRRRRQLDERPTDHPRRRADPDGDRRQPVRRRARPHRAGPPHVDRPVEHQAGDVAVPRLRVPACSVA